MDYICEGKAYTVVEFYNQFKDDLPQLVSVVQGYHGDRPEHDFHRDQVLCIQAVSRQQRVLSKFKGSTRQDRLFSIPWKYREELCIVRQGRAGKEIMLSKILGYARPPLTVCFQSNRTVTVGDASISTNIIPDIKLLQIVDEVHLLANSITDGKMYTDVVYVPLYFTQMRLSIITGIKTYSQNQWARFQKSLQDATSNVEYNPQYSNPDILEYDPISTHTALDTYTYVAPLRYTNIVSLTQRLVGLGKQEQQKVNKTSHQHQITHDNNGAQHHPASSHSVYNANVIKENFDEYEDIGSSTRAIIASDSKEGACLFASGSPLVIPRKTNNQAMPQSNVPTDQRTRPISMLLPLPENKAPALPKQRTRPISMLLPLPENKAPALPKRNVNKSTPIAHGDVSHGYSNDVPRTVVQPTVYNKQSSPQRPETSGQPIGDHVRFSSAPKVSNTQEVSKLTIEEVVAYLNKLGLGQYEETFRDQKIDGALLVVLDKDILRNDLGMKSIEALKITKFVKDGYVPV